MAFIIEPYNWVCLTPLLYFPYSAALWELSFIGRFGRTAQRLVDPFTFKPWYILFDLILLKITNHQVVYKESSLHCMYFKTKCKNHRLKRAYMCAFAPNFFQWFFIPLIILDVHQTLIFHWDIPKLRFMIICEYIIYSFIIDIMRSLAPGCR